MIKTGYSHYWYLNPKGKQKDLSGCLDNIKKVIQQHRDIIQYEEDEAKEPIAEKNLIRFNGIGEDGHETFLFQYPPDLAEKFFQKDEDGFVFSFCKTARKPYDIAVTKCLLILKEYLKEDMNLSSDGSFGNKEEWGDAIKEVSDMGIDIEPYLVVEEL